MASHPETAGYFTPEGLGFEWCSTIPELPSWILEGIKNKNERQGFPAEEKGRVVGPGFAINTRISLERDIQLAIEATWAMPPEAADDYDIWITAGQALHSLDESLLDVWEDWSKQSDKYRPGECQRRWKSFSKSGGRGVGSLIHIAKENGWQPKEHPAALNVSDDMLDHITKVLEEAEKNMAPVMEAELQEVRQETKQQKRLRGKEDGDDSKTKNKAASEISDMLLTLYKGDLRFSIPHSQFFMYQRERAGLWSPIMKVEMMGDIRNKLQDPAISKLIPQGFTARFLNDVYEQLQAVLCIKEWYEGNKYLLFTNGVLDVTTRELLPFKRELYLTQQIPYAYNPAATCEPIVKWLKHTQFDNWQRTQVLRAWLRATLLSTYEIQKFIEIVGPGKSGKSTYANLAVALVGKKNVYSTDFENLEKNRFEAASYMGKKLLLFQDADRWGGSVSRLKAITGNDWIRAERKYQNENYEPFQFKGLVIVTANEAIQSTDYTSGLARRRLTVPFDRPFTGGSSEQRDLIKFNTKGEPQGEFAALLPGLVNWLLDMTETEMREYLMETNQKVEFFKKYSHTQNLRSNSILDWMAHKVVYEPGVSAAIGFVKIEAPGNTHMYKYQEQWLYPSYAAFCKECNVNVMSRNRFEPLFLDICKHQLNLNVYSVRNKKGMRVFNVAVRGSDPKYEGYPSAVTAAANPDKFEPNYGVKIKADPNARMEDIDEDWLDE